MVDVGVNVDESGRRQEQSGRRLRRGTHLMKGDLDSKEAAIIYALNLGYQFRATQPRVHSVVRV